jgi:diguanylate cyclase (GGDEF)-like protein/PAS domain S-box-containing protein
MHGGESHVDSVDVRPGTTGGLDVRELIMCMADPTVLFAPVRDASGQIMDFVFEVTNAAADEFLGVPAGGSEGLLLTPIQRAAGTQWIFPNYVSVVETGKPFTVDDLPRQAPSWPAVRYFDLQAQRLLDRVLVTFRDVTAYAEATQALVASEELFRSAMASATVGMAIHDRRGVFSRVNPAWCAIAGRSEAELLGASLHELVHVEDRPLVVAAAQHFVDDSSTSLDIEIRLVRGDGSIVWTRCSGTWVSAHDGRDGYLLTQIVDTTLEHEQRAELEYHALHDSLTGLYNRAWISDMLDNSLRLRRRTGGGYLAALYLDLDNFKLINDSLGHAAGDSILQEVAQRLKDNLRPGDYAARLGGDEFLIVAQDIASPTEAEALTARVSSVVAQDVEIDGHQVLVGASIGVSLSGPDSTAASMLREGDAALFGAKESGRGAWRFFDPDMHKTAMTQLTTESEIRQGLRDGQFVPFYQPIIALDTMMVTGYEALVRWRHPERGIVPPMEFLPVAEQSGLIIQIGAQVLDQVCGLIASRPEVVGSFSVNKSPTQINRPGWRQQFLGTLKRHRIDPARLIIEVTESAVLTHIDKVVDDLRHVRRLGVGLHIDDFGTGYSSISLLRDLPVTGVKLDRSFTMNLADDEQARVVAAGLASLADGLHLDSVAEGIEDAEQATILADLGWSHGQGYLYGRPGPAPWDELDAALR